MRASSIPTVVVCSLALALGLPVGGAQAFAPGKSKSKGEATTAKDPGATTTNADPVPEPVEVDGPPRLGRIFVDADGLGEAGPVLAGRAMKVGRAGLEGQAVSITDAPAGPELRVVLSLRDSGGYRVEYEIVYDGEVVKDGTGGFDCQLCTEDELVEKVEALAVQVSPKLVVPEAEVEPGPGPGPGPDPDKGVKPGPGGPEDPIEDENPGGLGGKGKAGVALLVGGGLGVGAGVALLVIKPIPVDDPVMENGVPQAKNTKPLGGVVAGVGGALLITGIALLVVDRKQAKAKGSNKAAAMVHPWVGPGSGGLGVVGRF